MTSPALPGANQPRLIVLAGPLYGDVLALSGSELTIGRDPSNQICVGDLSLSRRHCAISTGAPEPRIRDLGSSNGTFVNGMQISDRPLADGDRIQLGESVFLFIAKAPNSSDVHVTSLRESPAQPTSRLRIEEAKYPAASTRRSIARCRPNPTRTSCTVIDQHCHQWPQEGGGDLPSAARSDH